jgi:conjugative relaxase-like TrwC/TraI family protein
MGNMMMKISGAQAESYYYNECPVYAKSGGGENMTWVGTGCAAHGLTDGAAFNGSEDRKIFKNLNDGMSADGKIRQVGRENGPQAHSLNAGTDVLLTHDKSIDIIAIADPRIREMLRQAHIDVARDSVERYVYGRQTVDGVTQLVKGSATMAVIDHGCSRAMDPQNHGHVFVENNVQRPDGTRCTLENSVLMDNQRNINQDLQNRLAIGLKELDYSLRYEKHGGNVCVAVEGVPKEVCEMFSKRAETIKNAHEMRDSIKQSHPDWSPAKVDSEIQLRTKAEKMDMGGKDMDKIWIEEATTKGFNILAIQSAAQELGASVDRGEPKTAADYIRYAISINVEKESVFSKESVLGIAVRLGIGDVQNKDVDKAFDQAIKAGDLKQLGGEKSNAYSTPGMIQMEREIAVAAVTQATSFTPLLSREASDAAIKSFEAEKGWEVSDGQRATISVILSGNEANQSGLITLIQGDSGSGKSTCMYVVNQALKEMLDLKIRGLGFTGKSAAELQKSSGGGVNGIESQTLDSFLLQKHEPLKPGQRELLLVDEASMVSTKLFSGILQYAQSAPGQIQLVTIGDGKQLQSLGAGALFSVLQKHELSQVTQITEVQRQKYYDSDGNWLKTGRDDISKATNTYAVEIAQDLKAGDFKSAFAKIDGAGKFTEIADRAERINTVAEKFVVHGDQEKAVVLVATNKDRKEVLSTIREMQKAEGQIGAEDFRYIVRDPISAVGLQKSLGINYQEGNFVTLNADMEVSKGVTLKAGSILEIAGSDCGTQQLTVNLNAKDNELKIDKRKVAGLDALKADGGVINIDLKEHGMGLQQFQKVEASYSIGEAIMLTRNNNTDIGRENGEKNGVRVILQSIDTQTGLATVKIEGKDGKIIEGYNLEDSYTTNGQALTGHKAQGISCPETIAMLDEADKKLMYVILTRHEKNVEIITGDKERLVESANNDVNKTSTLDYLTTEEMQALKDMATDSKEALELPTELEQIEARIEALLEAMENKYGIIRDQEQVITQEQNAPTEPAREKENAPEPANTAEQTEHPGQDNSSHGRVEREPEIELDRGGLELSM